MMAEERLNLSPYLADLEGIDPMRWTGEVV